LKLEGEARRLDEALTRYLLLLDMVPRQEATRRLRREETGKVQRLCASVEVSLRRSKGLAEEVAQFETGPAFSDTVSDSAGGVGMHAALAAIRAQEGELEDAAISGLPSPFSATDSPTPAGTTAEGEDDASHPVEAGARQPDVGANATEDASGADDDDDDWGNDDVVWEDGGTAIDGDHVATDGNVQVLPPVEAGLVGRAITASVKPKQTSVDDEDAEIHVPSWVSTLRAALGEDAGRYTAGLDALLSAHEHVIPEIDSNRAAILNAGTSETSFYNIVRLCSEEEQPQL